VRAVILVRSPKTLISSRVKEIEGVKDAFDVSGRFDTVALVDVEDLSAVKKVALSIHAIEGVRRTETLIG
jgi:uncharacterized protein with GYD domain